MSIVYRDALLNVLVSVVLVETDRRLKLELRLELVLEAESEMQLRKNTEMETHPGDLRVESSKGMTLRMSVEYEALLWLKQTIRENVALAYDP
jgi:hypothetical protein